MLYNFLIQKKVDQQTIYTKTFWRLKFKILAEKMCRVKLALQSNSYIFAWKQFYLAFQYSTEQWYNKTFDVWLRILHWQFLFKEFLQFDWFKQSCSQNCTFLILEILLFRSANQKQHTTTWNCGISVFL